MTFNNWIYIGGEQSLAKESQLVIFQGKTNQNHCWEMVCLYTYMIYSYSTQLLFLLPLSSKSHCKCFICEDPPPLSPLLKVWRLLDICVHLTSPPSPTPQERTEGANLSLKMLIKWQVIIRAERDLAGDVSLGQMNSLATIQPDHQTCSTYIYVFGVKRWWSERWYRDVRSNTPSFN